MDKARIGISSKMLVRVLEQQVSAALGGLENANWRLGKVVRVEPLGDSCNWTATVMACETIGPIAKAVVDAARQKYELKKS